MAGKGAEKRAHALAIRCAKLRSEGLPLSEIAKATGLDREKVAARVQLGERLLSLVS